MATEKPADALTLPELKAKLVDPWWRLCNLYSIVDDSANLIPFRPNELQARLYRELHHSNLILKARKMGFTTFIELMGLDQAMFNSHYGVSVIAHSLNDAGKIFRNMVRKPYDALPELVKQLCPVASASASEIVFANGSSISVSTSARGGTPQFLHVSEMGKIARKYPEKTNEIVSGAFEAVPLPDPARGTVGGIKFVESTAEGRAGWFHDEVQAARRRRDARAKHTAIDFKLHFYPWFQKPSNRIDPEGVYLTEAQRKYFGELMGKLGVKLDKHQQAWYAKKQEQLKDLMFREHPSTEDEAFQAAVDGMIYAEEMRALRQLGRIGVVPYRPGIKVNTFWDLGVNDRNCIWLHQRVGVMNRFLRFFWDQNKGMRHYWQLLEAWRQEHEAQWGSHYLPHDGDQRIQGHEVETRREILEQLGARNVVIVPRVTSVNDGIEWVKGKLSECEFDEEGCLEGIECLDNYSRDWDEAVGDWDSKPRHDKFSNGADAFRQFAQAFRPQDSNGPRAPASGGNWTRAGY